MSLAKTLRTLSFYRTPSVAVFYLTSYGPTVVDELQRISKINEFNH